MTIKSKLYLFCFALLLPITLMAADITQLSQDDLAHSANAANDPVLSGISIAKKLFGSMAEHPLQFGLVGDGDTMVNQILGIINLVLMAMASVWMTWTVVKGSLMTAHEGQFVGKAMHSAWVPFRLTVGTASLTPFFHGLCFAQIIMLYAIQMSIGGGNLAWQKAVDYIYKGNDIVSIDHVSVSDDLAQSVFNSELCQHAINYGMVKMGGEPNYGNGLSAVAGTWSFGSPSFTRTGFSSQCGAYKLPQQSSLQAAGAAQNAANQQAAFEHLVTSLDSEAERIAKGVFMSVTDPQSNPPVPANPAYIKQASAAYSDELKTMSKALAKQVNANNGRTEMQEKMKAASISQGFTTAGAWFFTLSSKNSEANAALSVVATLGKPALPPDNLLFIGVNDIYTHAFALTANATTNEIDTAQDDTNWIFTRIKDAICPHSNSGSLGQCVVADSIHIADDNENALIRIANFGNNITAIGAVGFTAIGAVKGFVEGTTDNVLTKGAALLGGGGIKGAGIGAVKPWFEVASNAFKTLFFFGIVCATYIPLIPAIVWIMRLVSIFAIWVEAVVSAPVWAFAHLETEGEGMGSRAGHGYLFLFNVLLNPMLSVLGLVLGTVLLDVMSLFVLQLYPDMISNATGDSWTGLIKIIALLMIFVMINLSLVNLCMQLINVVPDNVMDWVGGRMGAGIGKNGEDMVSGGAKGSLVGTTWIGNGEKKGQDGPTSIKPNVDGGTSILETKPKV